MALDHGIFLGQYTLHLVLNMLASRVLLLSRYSFFNIKVSQLNVQKGTYMIYYSQDEHYCLAVNRSLSGTIAKDHH